MPDVTWAAICGVAIAVLVFAVIAHLRRSATPSGFHPFELNGVIKGRRPLTANEWEFFGRLVNAVPEWRVCPQMAMGSLLTVERARDNGRAQRSRFDRKIVDFVILGPGGQVVALVELDDRTHQRDRDEQRDRMTLAAGYATLRYQSRCKPTVEKLRQDLADVWFRQNPAPARPKPAKFSTLESVIP